MNELALDYFILVFVAALGVLQMSAAYSGLRGLLFFRSRSLAFLMGLLLVVLAFLWFILSGPRNIPDTKGGLNGNQYAWLFTVAASAALILTLFFSSLRNLSMGRADGPYDSGLDALKETTFLRALFSTLRRLWRQFLRPTLRYFSG